MQTSSSVFEAAWMMDERMSDLYLEYGNGIVTSTALTPIKFVIISGYLEA